MSKRERITDRMRLDYLERMGVEEVEFDESTHAKECGESWIVGEGNWHPTLRQAIDAAIRASRKEKN